MLPDRIGRYRILARLGQGGMGELYHGVDDVLHREVAIKVLHAGGLQDPRARQRFYHEARAAAGLQHPNIVTVYEFVEEENPYLVMEFLRGEDLAARAQHDPALTVEEKLRIVVQLCDALQCAHAAGVIHRDIKPANTWIQSDGRVRLLDFGIAKVGSTGVTTAGTVVGSLAYMAPERLQGIENDPRSDVFAVGVLLYELLAGRRPFDGPAEGAIVLAIMREPPAPFVGAGTEVPPDLVRIALRALEKDPEARYQSAAFLSDDLKRVSARLADGPREAGRALLETLYVEPPLEQPDASSAAPTTSPAMPPRDRLRRTVLRVAAAFLILSGGTVAWWVGPANRPSRASNNSATPPVVTAASAAAPKPRAVVSVTSDPGGAEVRVNGRPVGTAPLRLEVDIAHLPVVRVEKPGFSAREERLAPVHLSGGVLAVRLQPVRARVVVTARGRYPFEVLEGARVISPSGQTHSVVVQAPLTLRLRAAQYFLNTTVHVDPPGPTRDIAVPPLGRLTVRTRDTCQVSVDGRAVGRPPINVLPIASGTHTLTLACPEITRRTITIRPNEHLREVAR